MPTAAEIGVPAWIVSTWYGLWAIKGTPKPIVERMYAEIVKALGNPKLQAIWKEQLAQVGGESSADFAKRIRAEIPAPPRPPLRTTMTPSRRIIKIRRAPEDPTADKLKVPAVAPGSGAIASRKRPSPAPLLGGSLSDGEYEFDGDDDTVDASEGTGVGGATATTKDDQSAPGSTAMRRRRLKKQFKPSAILLGSLHGGNDDDDDDDDAIEPEMLHIESQCFHFHSSTTSAASASMAHRDGSSRPRPTSTMIPDLASFASFHPITSAPSLPLPLPLPLPFPSPMPLSVSTSSSFLSAHRRRRSEDNASPSSGIWLPLVVPGASSSSALSSSSSDGGLGCVAASSQSPKRNVSDCQSIAIGRQIRPLDDQGARYGARATGLSYSGLGGAAAPVVGGLAKQPGDESQSSFILHGRSSSRSLNMFGATTKAQVMHAAGAGLANLHDLQASLPVTQTSMTD